jgi:hypothetical protein
MSIVVAEKLTEAPAGGFAPMIPAQVWDDLKNSPSGLRLYAWMQQKPAGWEFGGRDQMARDSGLPVGSIRTGIRDLIAAGYYLAERVQIEAGRWITQCKIFAQRIVAGHTEGSLREVGNPARIPPPREKKRERHALRSPRLPRPHDPATCPREAANQPCRDCAAAAAARKPEKPSAATHPAPPPVADVLAAALGETGTECEHGVLPGRCAFCRRRAAARVVAP